MSDERWIIPNSWQWVKLEEIVSRLGDGLHGTPKYDKEGKYFFINGNNLSHGVIEIKETTKQVSFDEYLKYKKNLNENTVLVSINGTIGNVAFYNNEKVILGKSACYFNLFFGINKNYIRYLINSNYFIRYALKLATGTTIKNVSLKTMRGFLVPLPPLNEQKRIVTKIEALQTRSTAVKEELEAIKPLLNQFRQSVLAFAFRGDLTKDWREQNPDVEPAEVLLERIQVERRRRWEEAELEKMKAKGKVPKDDKWKKKYKEPEPIDTEGLSELADGWCWINYELITQESQNGLSKRRGTQGQSISVLRLADIKNNKIAPEETREILLTDNEIERYLLYPNDLLCIRVNGSEDLVGRIIIFDQDNKWAFCDHFIRYKLVDKLVSVSYIANFFKTQVVRQYIKQYKVSSAGQNTVSQTTLGNLLTPIPPIKEQKEIVRRIESLFKLADSIEQQYQQAEIDLETLNQSILAKAFRGELVPQDPNDEPASVLLERIKEEREKAQPKKYKSKKKLKVTKAKQLGLDL